HLVEPSRHTTIGGRVRRHALSATPARDRATAASSDVATPRACRTAETVCALTTTGLPCQSQYSVATPDTRASSVSAVEGSGLGTSSPSEGSDRYVSSLSRLTAHACAPPLQNMVGMTFALRR